MAQRTTLVLAILSVTLLSYVHPFSIDARLYAPSLVLHATSYNNNANFRTAMESACLVEWEPVSELERRLEDGIHYEHWPTFPKPLSNRKKTALEEESSSPSISKKRGVFCGLRVTDEEYTRLKSADPKDHLS